MSILNVFKLLLPALFPSWRFFDVIGPSPRIEVCLVDGPEEQGAVWRECRPRPARLSALDRLKALFWNAPWNETLFLANCAERILQGQEAHCSRELQRRLRADLLHDFQDQGPDATIPPFFRFRLVFLSPHEGLIRRDIAFVSPLYETAGPSDR